MIESLMILLMITTLGGGIIKIITKKKLSTIDGAKGTCFQDARVPQKIIGKF
ncbi:MAG: hypothetical protein ACRCU3_04080 [Eubacteriaceae bacterium]